MKHAKEFDENLTKEQYRNLAAKLLSQSISMHVLGYDTEYRRVRYDKKNNIFALGDNKRKTVITLLKPIEGVKYYEADWQREFGDNK